MLVLVVFSLVLFSDHNCDQSSFIGTVLKIGEDSVVGQIDFETGKDDWTLKNMKIVDTADSLENVNNIPGEGRVAVPQVSMSGDQWGQVYKTFNIPALTRVAVEFSVFVSGFDSEAENSFMSTNPDLLVRLVALDTSSEKKLTNLARLKPQNNLWNKYRTEVQTESGLKSYRVSLEVLRGSGLIALDGVKVEIVPVVEEKAIRGSSNEVDVWNGTETKNNTTVIEIDATNTTTNSTDAGDNGSGLSKNSTVVVSNTTGVANNSTDIANSSNDLSNNSIGIANNYNDLANNSTGDVANNSTNTEQNSKNIDDGDVVTNSSSDSPLVTVNPDNHETVNITKNTGISGNSSSSTHNLSQDTSMYGYSGEIVLIILTVLFISLFLCMVYKYHRLKSHMGDYQLNQGGTRQSQDNQGYDVQMSYRMDD